MEIKLLIDSRILRSLVKVLLGKLLNASTTRPTLRSLSSLLKTRRSTTTKLLSKQSYSSY